MSPNPQHTLVDRWIKRDATEFKILAYLYAAAGNTPNAAISHSMKEIAQATGLRCQTVTSTMFTLESHGLIQVTRFTAEKWTLQIPYRYLCSPANPASVLNGLSLAELIHCLTWRWPSHLTVARLQAATGTDDEEYLQECLASLLRKHSRMMEPDQLISRVRDEAKSQLVK